MAKNTTKIDFDFGVGQDQGTDDALQTERSFEVNNLSWGPEGSARTRQPYRARNTSLSSGLLGRSHVVSDGSSLMYQTASGTLTLSDVATSTAVELVPAPPMEARKLFDSGADLTSRECSTAVLGNFLAVTYEAKRPTSNSQSYMRVYDLNTLTLIGEQVVDDAETPRATASGVYFVFSFLDVNTNNIRVFTFNTTDGTLSATTSILTNSSGIHTLESDSTHFYLTHKSNTNILSSAKVLTSTLAVAASYLPGTVITTFGSTIYTNGNLYFYYQTTGSGGPTVLDKVATSTMTSSLTANIIAAPVGTVSRMTVTPYLLSGTVTLATAATLAHALPDPPGPRKTTFVEAEDLFFTTSLEVQCFTTVLQSEGFTVQNGNGQEFPMVFVSDQYADESLQKHLVLVAMPKDSDRQPYSGCTPAGVFAVDEAYTPQSIAFADFPRYEVASAGNGKHYVSIMRQTGFDTPVGGIPQALYGVRTYELDTTRNFPTGFERFSRLAHTAGPIMAHPTDARPFESAVIGAPYIKVLSTSAGSLTGDFGYHVVWEAVDDNGVKIRSSPSPVRSTGSITSQQVTLTITCPRFSLTRQELGSTNGLQNLTYSMAVYRTLANGSVFYLVDRFQLEPNPYTGTPGNAALGEVVFVDNTPDATIEAGEVLRHGVIGGDLGPIVPPASSHVFTWRDRLCVVSIEDNRVWYSMPLVLNRGPEFSPVLTFGVPAQPIAGASLNNNAVVFAPSSTYVVGGSLANAAGIGQNVHVQRLSNSLGCVNKHSVYLGNAGIYFQSKRGIEVLTEKYEFVRIRGMDDALGKEGFTIKSADANPKLDEVLFTMENASGNIRVYKVNETNLNVSYDTFPPGLVANGPYSLHQHAGEMRGVGIRAGTNVWLETTDSVPVGADVDETGTPIEIKPSYTTPWYQLDGTLGDQELESIWMKFRMASVFGTTRTSIRVTEYYDHSETAFNTRTINLGTLSTDIDNPPIQEIRFRARKQRCQALRLRIDYDDVGGTGKNTVIQLIQLRAELGVIPGGARVTPNTQTQVSTSGYSFP